MLTCLILNVMQCAQKKNMICNGNKLMTRYVFNNKYIVSPNTIRLVKFDKNHYN